MRRLRTAAAVLALLAATAPAGEAAARAVRPGASVKAIWGPAIRDGASLFPIYRNLGVRIYEDKLAWSTIAPTRPGRSTDPRDPAYRWPAAVSAAVAQAKRYHIRVALQIIGAPRWANGGQPSNWAPANPQTYADFAAAAARRYPSAHLWMIWGEPSRTPNFQPLTPAPPFAPLDAQQRTAPQLYARILDGAYAALKRASRANLVIGGMTYTTGDIRTAEWIESMRLPDGRPPRLDLYGHNPFSFREPNLANPPSPEQSVDFSDLRRLAALVDRNLGRPGNRHPRLFVSEWTVPTDVDEEFSFYVDPRVQARWIAAALRIARTWPRIYAVGWIHLFDEPPVSHGGLIQTDGTRKPGYSAWKAG